MSKTGQDIFVCCYSAKNWMELGVKGMLWYEIVMDKEAARNTLNERQNEIPILELKP